MARRKIYLLILFGLTLFLPACGESVQKKIYNHLEEAVSLEKEFENQQDKLVDLEKQEQDIYKQLIDLPIDELDKINELSQQAIDIIDERSDKINLEKESLNASKEEFIKTEKLIEKLTEEDLHDVAQKMYDTMIKRYEAYDQFNKEYVSSLKLEKELYTILMDEDSTQEELSTHLSKLNKGYEKIIDINKTFNLYTTDYNKLKKKFYQMANMNVQFKGDS